MTTTPQSDEAARLAEIREREDAGLGGKLRRKCVLGTCHRALHFCESGGKDGTLGAHDIRAIALRCIQIGDDLPYLLDLVASKDREIEELRELLLLAHDWSKEERHLELRARIREYFKARGYFTLGACACSNQCTVKDRS